MSVWNRERIEQLIKDQVEEHLSLDYKAAGALEKSDKKRIELTKDVSAFANSSGGLLFTVFRRRDTCPEVLTRETRCH